MDSTVIKADPGNAEYYLNRLIQRALIEPKPLLKIYEEECQRHPDISVTVMFKEFQSALQKHCLTLQKHCRNQNPVNALVKQHEMNLLHKEYAGKFTSLGEFVDQRRRRRRPDMQNQMYQRMPLERFGPQAGQANNNIYYRNGMQQSSAMPVNIKTEDTMQPSASITSQPPSHTVSRPPSVQPPVEEEPPPEFIEMSSNPPGMPSNCQFSDMNIYQGQVSDEKSITPASDNGANKAESKEPTNNNVVDGAVQSSSTPDKTSLLSAEDISPLNVRCVKCITALVTCAVMPCGHCCLCNICGQTVLSLKQVCPVCRKSVSTVIGYSNLIYNVYR
uniref:RING-type domain-containing protein n=1 Tax=Graphocephala atropunctata TaxID=36148 RepID=A0A1B6MKY5_9HEMI